MRFIALLSLISFLCLPVYLLVKRKMSISLSLFYIAFLWFAVNDIFGSGMMLYPFQWVIYAFYIWGVLSFIEYQFVWHDRRLALVSLAVLGFAGMMLQFIADAGAFA